MGQQGRHCLRTGVRWAFRQIFFQTTGPLRGVLATVQHLSAKQAHVRSYYVGTPR
jgi:hypothetical protein